MSEPSLHAPLIPGERAPAPTTYGGADVADGTAVPATETQWPEAPNGVSLTDPDARVLAAVPRELLPLPPESVSTFVRGVREHVGPGLPHAHADANLDFFANVPITGRVFGYHVSAAITWVVMMWGTGFSAYAAAASINVSGYFQYAALCYFGGILLFLLQSLVIFTVAERRVVKYNPARAVFYAAVSRGFACCECKTEAYFDMTRPGAGLVVAYNPAHDFCCCLPRKQRVSLHLQLPEGEAQPFPIELAYKSADANEQQWNNFLCRFFEWTNLLRAAPFSPLARQPSAATVPLGTVLPQQPPAYAVPSGPHGYTVAPATDDAETPLISP